MADGKKRRNRRTKVTKNKKNLITIKLRDGLIGHDAETDVTQISRESFR